ncbi:MAG: hypothetical protein GTO45_13950 [Candidatus Aminicenantes bacterium]|nr:hypothetical protein [Candidatus Aminicenantes bacterium]NIM79872.1 hypothetical protein [Candidatus Aminicenantes bacterium]NIN19208.1 hypothetical protein [Candidatus Aminicenantes bacterium]NIN43113.1 hypothetical protein [Candidatus Aminicenantes bacterium]NIN85850.1 hypothetical protein [Candidatus Aminicenantes bacterium]
MKPKKIKKEGRHIKVQRLRNSEMKATLGAQAQQQPDRTYSCGKSGDKCRVLTVNIYESNQLNSATHHTVDIYM